jgi:hypothetical protein
MNPSRSRIVRSSRRHGRRATPAREANMPEEEIDPDPEGILDSLKARLEAERLPLLIMQIPMRARAEILNALLRSP